MLTWRHQLNAEYGISHVKTGIKYLSTATNAEDSTEEENWLKSSRPLSPLQLVSQFIIESNEPRDSTRSEVNRISNNMVTDLLIA
jgi:hypothetical protein